MSKPINFLRGIVGRPIKRRQISVSKLVAAGNDANSRRAWAQASAAYAEALGIDPSLGAVWVQYGHALKEQGFLPVAEQAYRTALNLGEAVADTYLQLGHVLKLQGRNEASLQAYTESYLREPTSPHSLAELLAAGAKIPEPETLAAFRHTGTIADKSGTAISGGSHLQPRSLDTFSEDQEFVQSLYGRDGRTNGSLGTTTYVSLAHLLFTVRLEPDFVDIFDAEFYFYANPTVRNALRHLNRNMCLVHFCEKGLDQLIPFAEKSFFDSEFYCQTYLAGLSFLPSNAYRHWLNVGLRKNWAPNRAAWIKSVIGTSIGDPDSLDVPLNTTLVDPKYGGQRWTEQFLSFVNGAAADSKAAIRATDQSAEDLALIADYMSINGLEKQSFALYQRIIQNVPQNWRALRHYADGLFRRECVLEAAQIYRHLVDKDPGRSPWAYINLAQCAERLGQSQDALKTMRLGIENFPGDLGLRRRFDDLAEAFFSREWSAATAMGQLGHLDAAQARLEQTCSTLSTLTQTRERLQSQPIKRVAIVANLDLEQCRFYRVEQKIEQLQMAGYEVELFDFHTETACFTEASYRFQAVIFYRVPAFYNVIAAIQKAVELGLFTFYEIDDLIFDAAEYPSSLESYGGQIEKDEYVGLKLGVPLFAHAMSLCEFGIASTVALAEQMQSRVATGRVFVHRNGFGKMHTAYANRSVSAGSDDHVSIFYGSGTKAHKEDFLELVEPALVELVRRHGGRIAIVLMGYIPMSEGLQSIKDNVTLLSPNWNIDEYWQMLSQFDVNIAVLKPSLMADSKSEIKWLEAAMFAIPSIVSDTVSLRAAIEHEVTGLICTAPEDWTVALDRLVSDGDLRRRIGHQAKQRAHTFYGMEVMARNIGTILNEVSPPEPALKRRTILIVNVFYPPQAIGGATRVVHDNVRHLAAKYGERFNIEVFTSIEGGLEPYKMSSFVLEGVRVTGVTTPDEAGIDTKTVDDRMAEIFGRYLDDVAPALVHFHCIQRLTTTVVTATLQRGIPYLISVHDGWWISDAQFLVDNDGGMNLYNYSDPVTSLRTLGPISFNRLMQLQRPLQGAAGVLAVSAPFAELYRSCGVANVTTVANGVSELPQPRRSVSPDGKVRLGFIGGMASHKGFDLIKYAVYGQSFDNLRLLVIDHSMEAGESRREMWGTTEVEFRPKVSQTKVGQLYGDIDVLLAPSIWPESYGLVTREALHCGCWIVASDRGNISEYVSDGHNGFVVDVSSPDGLIGALEKIDRDPKRYLVSPAEIPIMRQANEQGDQLAALYEVHAVVRNVDGTKAPTR